VISHDCDDYNTYGVIRFASAQNVYYPFTETYLEASRMKTVEPSMFLDRRIGRTENPNEWVERRQFGESRDALSLEVRELAEAMDQYKLDHKRRYITLAEVLEVVKSLGYHR